MRGENNNNAGRSSPEDAGDATFENLTYTDGFESGYTEGFDDGRREGTDWTLAGAILIALLGAALGFIFALAFDVTIGRPQ